MYIYYINGVTVNNNFQLKICLVTFKHWLLYVSCIPLSVLRDVDMVRMWPLQLSLFSNFLSNRNKMEMCEKLGISNCAVLFCLLSNIVFLANKILRSYYLYVINLFQEERNRGKNYSSLLFFITDFSLINMCNNSLLYLH